MWKCESSGGGEVAKSQASWIANLEYNLPPSCDSLEAASQPWSQGKVAARAATPEVVDWPEKSRREARARTMLGALETAGNIHTPSARGWLERQRQGWKLRRIGNNSLLCGDADNQVRHMRALK